MKSVQQGFGFGCGCLLLILVVMVGGPALLAGSILNGINATPTPFHLSTYKPRGTFRVYVTPSPSPTPRATQKPKRTPR